MRPDPDCNPSSSVETLEHLICKCKFYSELQCHRLGDVLVQHLNIGEEDLVPRVELGQNNFIFNMPHPLILLHIHVTRNTLYLLTQEIKRDVIYRTIKVPPSAQ
jgi:hypothetical protein